MKNRSHRYVINRTRPRYGYEYTLWNVYQYDNRFVEWATPKEYLKINLWRKLSHTEIKLKKSIAYKKKRVAELFICIILPK